MSGNLPEARAIADRQAAAVAEWYRAGASVPAVSEPDAFLALVLDQCAQNFQLWNQEDQARRTDVPDAVIAGVKRAIDGLNQRRNDLVEKLDEALLAGLGSLMKEGAELNSETPGAMIDRLSILALKCHHMERESLRAEAGADHRARCAGKLAVLRQQREDLTGCLGDLLAAARAGTRRFKVYRQYKMYNDPGLNPELYRRR